jgi:hypothetical protein
MPYKFIFLKFIPRDNFGELLRFSQKGWCPKKFKPNSNLVCFLNLSFKIHLEFEFVSTWKVVPFFLYSSTPKSLVICGVWVWQFCHFTKLHPREKIFELNWHWVGPTWQPCPWAHTLSLHIGRDACQPPSSPIWAWPRHHLSPLLCCRRCCRPSHRASGVNVDHTQSPLRPLSPPSYKREVSP